MKIEEAQRGPYAAKVYGFSHLEVTQEKMTLRHLDETGKLIHAFEKMQDGSVKIV